MNRIALVQGDTLLTPDQGKTWASVTIQIGGMQLRQPPPPRARRLSRKRPRSSALRNSPSPTARFGGGKKVRYANYRRQKLFYQARPEAAGEGEGAEGLQGGRQIRSRVDIPVKVTGPFTYMQDFRVPGMLHGRVLRPPAIGAKLESVDEGSLKGVAGIVKVVREGNFLAVVA